MSPTEQIRDAIKESLSAADAANCATNSLTNLILNHQPSLISDATIVRETATLLQHVVQNFNRTASAVLDLQSAKKNGRRK